MRLVRPPLASLRSRVFIATAAVAALPAYGPVAGTAPGSPARKHWTGVLRGFRDGAVELEVDGVLHRVPHDQIAKANLEYDFEADLRRKD